MSEIRTSLAKSFGRRALVGGAGGRPRLGACIRSYRYWVVALCSFFRHGRRAVECGRHVSGQRVGGRLHRQVPQRKELGRALGRHYLDVGAQPEPNGQRTVRCRSDLSYERLGGRHYL